LIYNAGSNYPNSGGKFGSITLSGNGTISLTPAATGPYADVLICQPAANTVALNLSGNAMSGVSGTIYAPSAQLIDSGNAQLTLALVVDTLTLSGNAVMDSLTSDALLGTVAYTPAQIRDAYGLNAAGAGLSTPATWDGAGQTIAIVDAYHDPNIDQAVDAFDSQFGLTASGPSLEQQYGPASSFLTVLNQDSQANSPPAMDPNGSGTNNWEIEESLDVEWTHAIAPGARIILVEADSPSLSDLMAGVATAASQPGASVVSMSWGFPEGQSVLRSDEATYDSIFQKPGVTFIASTGDASAADPQYPASSPDVVAVGGTSLYLNANGSYNRETVWGNSSQIGGASIGSGGGISRYEGEPSYQQGVQSLGYRTTPDVSLVADPATGVWVAVPSRGTAGDRLEVAGGTSLSAPAWAGLLVLVNQGRAAAGEPTLNSSSPTEAQQALYSLPRGDYHVISSARNGDSASSRYNLATGLGTPVANSLVPDLVAYHGRFRALPSSRVTGPGLGLVQHSVK
jgi:subtilase family serine protease